MEIPVSKESPAIFAQFVPKPYADFFFSLNVLEWAHYMDNSTNGQQTKVLVVNFPKIP